MKYCCLILWLLLTVGCQSNESHIQTGSVVNGVLVPANHEAVSFTVGLFDVNLGPFCSGVVIGKRAILTAAHCLDNRSHEDLRIAFGNVISKSKAITKVHFTIMHPEYDPDMHTSDVGIIILKEDIPAGLKKIPLYQGKIIEDSFAVESYGFSRHTEDVSKDLFDYIDGVASDFKPNDLFRKKEELSLNGKLLLARYNGEDTIMLAQQSGGVCRGDSGGPTIMIIDKEKVLMGINWYITANDKGELSCSREAGITPVTHFFDWIKETVTTWTPEDILVRKISKKAEVNNDLVCLNIFANTLKDMVEANNDFCKLSNKLEKNITDSEIHCQSLLSKSYPAYLERTKTKLEKLCK